MPTVLGGETHTATGVITFGTQTLGVNTSGLLTLNGTAQRLSPQFQVPTSASFTTLNLGTGGTFTGGNNNPLSLLVPQAATAGDFDVRFAYVAASGTWTVTALLDFFGPGGNAYPFYGLVHYNTSTGATTVFGVNSGAGQAYLQIENFTGYANQASAASVPSGQNNPAAAPSSGIWLRITCNGTTINYYASLSGLANTWYLVGSQSFSGGGSPNGIGFGAAPQNLNSVTGTFMVNLQHWEKAASVVTAGSAYGFPS